MLKDAIVLDLGFLKFDRRFFEGESFQISEFFYHSFSYHFILVSLRPGLTYEIRTIYVSSGLVEMLKEAVVLDPDFLRFDTRCFEVKGFQFS